MLKVSIFLFSLLLSYFIGSCVYARLVRLNFMLRTPLFAKLVIHPGVNSSVDALKPTTPHLRRANLGSISDFWPNFRIFLENEYQPKYGHQIFNNAKRYFGV